MFGKRRKYMASRRRVSVGSGIAPRFCVYREIGRIGLWCKKLTDFYYCKLQCVLTHVSFYYRLHVSYYYRRKEVYLSTSLKRTWNVYMRYARGVESICLRYPPRKIKCTEFNFSAYRMYCYVFVEFELFVECEGIIEFGVPFWGTVLGAGNGCFTTLRAVHPGGLALLTTS